MRQINNRINKFQSNKNKNNNRFKLITNNSKN